MKGPSQDVYFEEKDEPGQLCASAFTHITELV